MKLLRIQIPDYKVLKNIDIGFEREFNPSIFPIGSQNGGGKSTLLQLVFMLLHSPTYPERIKFLNNMFPNKGLENTFKKEIAILNLLHNEKEIQLEFSFYTNSYLKENQNLTADPKRKFITISAFPQDTSIICEMTVLQSGENIEIENQNGLLKEISEKIFLAAPATQVYLFLPNIVKNKLFEIQNPSDNQNYQSHLKNTQKYLPGLFTYNFLPIDLMIEFFKSAFKEDQDIIIRTNKYGDNFPKLVRDLQSLLNDKQIKPDENLSKVVVKKIEPDKEETELLPEDLSHGELRRVTIYTWLKHNNIKNSVVLMDEIEIALHPDWQYQIIDDLIQWEPSNQYIIATHSYELCTAVTPAHVKEIEPKLKRREKDESQ